MPARLAQGRRYAETLVQECSFPVTFPPKVVVLRLTAVGSEKFGVVDSTSFLVGFASLGLVSRGSPALSWFFAVAVRTFGYVTKTKLKFGLWILNASFGHLLSILGVCSGDV